MKKSKEEILREIERNLLFFKNVTLKLTKANDKEKNT